jgi:hypothetical protein
MKRETIMTLLHTTNIASGTGSYAGTKAIVTEVAITKQWMTIEGKRIRPNSVLPPDFMRSLRRENRRALLENGFVEIHATSLELAAADGGS